MVNEIVQFEKSSEFYNLIYGKKDNHREAIYINNFIKKYTKNVDRILELGCGTGRHLLEMLKLGYKVTGIDLSNEMLNMIPKLGSSSTNNILFLLFMCNYLVNVFNCIVNLLPLPTALSTVIFPL